MADLKVKFCGIKSPNPFWLASAPPTDKAYNIERAFRAGLAQTIDWYRDNESWWAPAKERTEQTYQRLGR